MSTATSHPCSVLCVDDNPHVADALRAMFIREPSFQWLGWLSDASGLIERTREDRPEILIFDLDMPGPDPLETLSKVSASCPGTRAVVFSGHIKKDLINRAIDAGAWAYISKNEGEKVLLETIGKVMQGQFILSPQVRAVLES